jgi:hypothetical protein
MKTNNIFRTALIAVAFLGLTGLSAYAKKPAISPATKIQTMIKENITFPAIAVKEGFTGSVDVVFTLAEDGKIIVKKTTAESAKIEKMVKEQLSSMTLKDVKTTFNQHYWIRITFDLAS